MRLYRDLTVDELKAEIAAYRAAIRTVLGGETTELAGEGRRWVVTPVNLKEVRAELRELFAELCRRPGYEDQASSALGVEIG